MENQENHQIKKTIEQDCNNYILEVSTSSRTQHINRQIPQNTAIPNERSTQPCSSHFQGYGCLYNSSLMRYDPYVFSRTLPLVAAHPSGSLTKNAVLESSNLNNNCNKNRAASHSSAIEMQHHLPSQHQIGHMNMPTYMQYHDQQQLKISNFPKVAPGSSIIFPTCRRNSTTAVFHDVADSHYHHKSSYHHPHLNSYHPSKVHDVLNQHLPMYSYHNRIMGQGSFRRDRHSVGGPTANDPVSNSSHRRNSIPNAVLVMKDTDDEDDVFDDSLPNSSLTSTTDPLFYREKLRDFRKRSMNSSNLSSQSNYPYPRNETKLYTRSRFQNHEISKDGMNMQREPKRHCTANISRETSAQQNPDMPSSSGTSPTDKSSLNMGKEEAATSNDTKESLQVSSLTPCPILKNAKTRRNQNYLKPNTEADKVCISHCPVLFGSSDGHQHSGNIKMKKQVAWKDFSTAEGRIKILSEHIDDCKTNTNKNDISAGKSMPIQKNTQSIFSAKDQIGPYLFGPQLGTSPVRSIKQFLVRKKGSFEYYMAKVLNMDGNSCDDRSGRMLLYSECSLLTFLKDHPGVIRKHGFHKDIAINSTGKQQERLCLVLDCLTSHNFDPETNDYFNLQQYLIKAKKMSEKETIRIFMSIVQIVNSLHNLNVVHRDLKLGNMVLLRKSQKVILTNFGLGRHLLSDGELLKDRRGSPAYISPDVLSNKPYTGKPSDMWSLGVVLYMMLYRQFPFYDQEPKKLFQKIKKVDFVVPSNSQVSTQVNEVIYGLLTADAACRLTAEETLCALHRFASSLHRIQFSQLNDQIVPDVDNINSSFSEEEKQMENDEKYSERNSNLEFRMINDDEDLTAKHKRGFGRQNCQSTLPAIQYCMYDARPLSEDDMVMHRQLLANSSSGIRDQDRR